MNFYQMHYGVRVDGVTMNTILTNLGFEIDRLKPRHSFDEVAARKLITTYVEWRSETYDTRGGATRDKSQKRRDMDQAVFDALSFMWADHPDHPLGQTNAAVQHAVEEAINKTETKP